MSTHDDAMSGSDVDAEEANESCLQEEEVLEVDVDDVFGDLPSQPIAAFDRPKAPTRPPNKKEDLPL